MPRTSRPTLSLLLLWLLWLPGFGSTAANAVPATSTSTSTSTAPAPAPAPAAPERWSAWADTPFRQYTSPLVTGAGAMAQDAAGILWLGTQSGLLRWDGYRFRSYTADPSTPGTLSNDYVRALHVDARGRLWVGTDAGGLARFDATSDRFVHYPVGAGGTRAASVRAITGDGAGGLWVGTADGLDHVGTDDRIQPPAALAGLPDASVDGVLLTRGGVLWLATSQGLLRRGEGDVAFAPVPVRGTAQGAAPVFTVLCEDSAGRVWAGSRAHGVFMAPAEGGGDAAAAVVAVVERGPAPALASDRVGSLVEARPGTMWVGTEGGIVEVDADRGVTRRIQRRAGLASSLVDNDVMAMLRDRSGIVWVATNDALHQHDPQQRAVVTLLGGTDRPEAISHANVPFVLPMADGRVWLAVGSGGVDIVEPTRGRVAQLLPDAAHPLTALPKARVLTMAAAPRGDVYLGTRLGLYLSDTRASRIVRLGVAGRDATEAVGSLCLDGDTLWMGGPDGLTALDVRVPGRPVLRRRYGGMGDARVVSLLRGEGDRLWIGTSAGLYRLDIASGRLDAVPLLSTDGKRLPAGYVAALLGDRRGRLWVASFGNGVLLKVPSGAGEPLRFQRFGTREGLPHLGVDMLLEDARGDIWASTDDGLAVIDGEHFGVRALQRPQGVTVLTHWSNAGAVTAAGELLFGGQGGLAVVRPERLTAWTWRPPVVVTDARVGDRSLPPGAFNAGGTETPRRVELAPATRGLWFEFAALDFSWPEHNRYAYRLDGFDADWIPTDATRRLASYTNLPPGDYTLQLRGSNRDGVWSQPPLAIPIRVLPAWHQTAWFRAGIGVAAMLLVAGLVQARTLYLRRRQRELEALVGQRTAELERRSEELHESQRRLELIAYADPLTGMPNRRVFNEDLRREIAQTHRHGEPLALLLIDLDGFKAVNDTHGHAAGDALLVECAARLTHALREGDRVARLGGDEFAVLLARSHEPGVVDSVCARVVASLGEPVSFEGAALRVTASIGVALHPQDGATPDVLYQAADGALYQAKRGGRNTWRWVSAPDRPARAPE